jgi:hypothetical protein
MLALVTVLMAFDAKCGRFNLVSSPVFSRDKGEFIVIPLELLKHFSSSLFVQYDSEWDGCKSKWESALYVYLIFFCMLNLRSTSEVRIIH